MSSKNQDAPSPEREPPEERSAETPADPEAQSGAPSRTSRRQLEEQLDRLRRELLAANTALEQSELARAEHVEVEISRDSYAELFDFAPVAYLQLDRHGVILGLNLTAAQLFGLDRRALIRRPLVTLIAASDRRKFLSHIAQAKRGGNLVLTELTVQPKGGPPVHVQMTSAPLPRESPGPMRYHTALVDLTERKRAEQELQTALRTLDAILANMRSGTLVVGDEGRVAFANQAFCDIFRLKESPAALAGAPSEEILRKVHDSYLHPDEQAARIREILRQGRPVAGEEVALQGGQVLLRDFVPISIQGIPYGRLWQQTDITDLKRAETLLAADLDALARMHSLSMRTLESDPLEPLLQDVMEAAVAISGADKGILQLLEGGTLRIVVQHGHERPFLDFFASAGNVASVCGEAMQRGERVIVRDVEESPLLAGTPSLEVLRAAGVRTVQSTPLMTRAGNLLGVLTTHWSVPRAPDERALWRLDLLARQAADLIEQKRAGENLLKLNATLEQRVTERTAEVQRLADQLRALASELTQTEQRERQRLAKILHDNIQQLLVAAQMQLSLIKREDPKIIQSAAHGVAGILAETLDASRSLTVELCPPILHQSGLTAALNWLSARLEAKNQFKVHLRTQNDAEPNGQDVRAFLFDAAREILLNAVKHSGMREANMTMVRTRDDCCRIIVEDKGRGFDPASVKPGRSGGFGLFSIQQRLLHLGGKLEIESAPGKGARAVLTIPIGREAEALPGAPAAGPPAGEIIFKQKARRISVLLADDHKIMRQGLAALLQFESDIEVVAEAENGREAVELAREFKPDVVIMDVNMPVMSGTEATKVLNKEMPGVKVIALSVLLDGAAANAMRESGAVAFLTKGGPSEDLVETIRACCRRQAAKP